MFQSTPAAFHGRPDLSRALTDELRALLPPSANAHPAGAGPERAMTGVGNTARWIAAASPAPT